MKKSFGILFGLSVLAFLDGVLAYLFPINYQYQSLSLIWHFFFIGVMVLVHDKPWKTRVLIGALCGLLLDYLFNDSFPYCFLVYPIFGFWVGYFEPLMYRTKPAFLIYLLFCFLIDLFPYIFQRMTGVLNVPFLTWLYHMELLTMIANCFEITLIMYVDLVMVRFFLIQKHRRAREARQQMDKLRSTI